MIRDARSIADGAELSADVCIVGAGAAGITLARRLSGRGLRLLLLESGRFENEPATQALYAGTMSGIDSWKLDNHRWRQFGGSTARWAGWCMPLLPSDFRRRDYIPESGWPIAFEDLVPYYRLAHEDLELIDFDYDPAAPAASGGYSLIDRAGTGRLETHLYQFSPPTRMGTRYRAELASAADVDVVLAANLTQVVLDGPLARVDHLACATLEGVRFTAVADRFVLAMGGLENARILLASNAQLPAGVANSSGLVGKYFMEHPHLYSAVMWAEPGRFDDRFYRKHRARIGAGDEGGIVRGAFALSEETRAAEGLPHLLATCDPGDLDTAPTGDIPASAALAMARPGRGGRLLTLAVRAEQVPTEESAMSLRPERDALGLPRIDLHWAVSDGDRAAYARALEILGAELAAAGLGRLWTPVDADGRFGGRIGPGGHHMGTARMHADRLAGVVDANCRAHDLANLYVAGSATFTTGGAANPTLTLVALAERLAAHLLDAEDP